MKKKLTAKEEFERRIDAIMTHVDQMTGPECIQKAHQLRQMAYAVSMPEDARKKLLTVSDRLEATGLEKIEAWKRVHDADLTMRGIRTR